jgi:hypothetical protein
LPVAAFDFVLGGGDGHFHARIKTAASHVSIGLALLARRLRRRHKMGLAEVKSNLFHVAFSRALIPVCGSLH